MARFLVFHTGSEVISQEEIVEAARRLQGSLPEGLKWLNSWFIPSEFRMICEWEAEDKQALQSYLAQAMPLLPVEAIHEVEPIRPEWYK
jgi:muconolactone delta-isomerase